MTPGHARGKTTCQSVRSPVHPSIQADSSNAIGIESMKPFMKNTPTGTANEQNAITNPRLLLSRCALA